MGDLERQVVRARAEGGAFLLPPRLRLRLSGGDAFRYLNGQVTRDLGRLGDGESLPACILTPKGKLCALLLVSRDGADLLIESEPTLEDALVARLERYIVADDVSVTVEPAAEMIHLFGAASERAPWASLPGIRVSRLGCAGKDFATAAIGDGIPELLDPAVVEILRIERGIPKWGAELTEETLPPEAGLDRTHIDYDRGCYPGQEVISRLKSIGRVNRILHVLSAPAGTPPAFHSPLFTGEGSAAGLVTSAAALPPGKGFVAMGYLPRGAGGVLFAADPLTEARTPLSITAIIGT